MGYLSNEDALLVTKVLGYFAALLAIVAAL